MIDTSNAKWDFLKKKTLQSIGLMTMDMMGR